MFSLQVLKILISYALTQHSTNPHSPIFTQIRGLHVFPEAAATAHPTDRCAAKSLPFQIITMSTAFLSPSTALSCCCLFIWMNDIARPRLLHCSSCSASSTLSLASVCVEHLTTYTYTYTYLTLDRCFSRKCGEESVCVEHSHTLLAVVSRLLFCFLEHWTCTVSE